MMLRLQQQEEALAQRKKLQEAEMELYRARTDELRNGLTDAAGLQDIMGGNGQTPVADENTPVGAAGPEGAPLQSRDLSPSSAPSLPEGSFPTSQAGGKVQAWQRNNNPGNLRVPGKNAFQSFPDMDSGLAALSKQLYIDGTKHGIKTLAQFFKKYAPETDGNDPVAYAAGASKRLGIGPNDPVDLTDPSFRAKLMPLITEVETGRRGLFPADRYAKAAGVQEAVAQPQHGDAVSAPDGQDVPNGGLGMSNILAAAGNSMSDAGPGYAMQGAQATPQAADQAAGMNPAIAQRVAQTPQTNYGMRAVLPQQTGSQAPQSRGALNDAINQRWQLIQARKQQVQSFQPTSKAGMAQKAQYLQQLDQAERDLLTRAQQAQTKREEMERQAIKDSRSDRNESRANATQDRAVQANDRANSLAAEQIKQHQITNGLNQARFGQDQAKEWGKQIDDNAKQFSEVPNTQVDPATGETRDKASIVDPSKFNTLKSAIVAHYGEGSFDEQGNFTPSWNASNKDYSDIATKMGTFSSIYDELKQQAKLRYLASNPAAQEALKNAKDPDQIRDIQNQFLTPQVDAAIAKGITPQVLFSELDRRWAQAHPESQPKNDASAGSPGPQPQEPPAPSSPEVSGQTGQTTVPTPRPTSQQTPLPLPIDPGEPDMAGQFVNQGDASVVPSDPGLGSNAPARLPTPREIQIDLENKANQDWWNDKAQGIMGALKATFGGDVPDTSQDAMSNDLAQRFDDAAGSTGASTGPAPTTSLGMASLFDAFKPKDTTAEVLNKYQSATPEERAYLDQMYPQLKNLSDSLMGAGM